MRTRHWLWFAALCLLSGSGWLVDQASPPVLSGPLRVAIQDGVLALVFAVATRLRGSLVRITRARWIELALAGIALLAVPSIVAAGAASSVPDIDGVLCYAFVPVAVIFILSQASANFGAEESPLRLLVPALAGLGGAALILPFHLPTTLGGKAWLLAIIISAIASGYAAIRLHRLLAGAGVLQQCAILCSAASVAAACFYRLDYMPFDHAAGSAILVEALSTLFLEGPILLLLVYLLREMSPIAISTRLLLIPLITIVEGFLIVRFPLRWTDYTGVILMAASALVLLRAEEPCDAPEEADPAL